jgi:hypothetical protein
MIRLLAIAVAFVALSVTAAPAEARVGGKMHLDDITLGTSTDTPFPLTAWWLLRDR